MSDEVEPSGIQTPEKPWNSGGTIEGPAEAMEKDGLPIKSSPIL
jgi:hypothetical protein